MSISLFIPTSLQPAIGNKEFIEVEGTNIGECLKEVYRQYPQLEKMLMDRNRLRNYIGIYINGHDAFPDEMTKTVKSGDTVHILYTIAGGS
jgi:molybdopterin converting factor small subunit